MCAMHGLVCLHDCVRFTPMHTHAHTKLAVCIHMYATRTRSCMHACMHGCTFAIQGPGHVVVMTLDMHTHEAWFSVNGTKPRLGFRNLPNVAWPCISLQAPAVVEVWYGGG